MFLWKGCSRKARAAFLIPRPFRQAADCYTGLLPVQFNTSFTNLATIGRLGWDQVLRSSKQQKCNNNGNILHKCPSLPLTPTCDLQLQAMKFRHPNRHQKTSKNFTTFTVTATFAWYCYIQKIWLLRTTKNFAFQIVFSSGYPAPWKEENTCCTYCCYVAAATTPLVSCRKWQQEPWSGMQIFLLLLLPPGM